MHCSRSAPKARAATLALALAAFAGPAAALVAPTAAVAAPAPASASAPASALAALPAATREAALLAQGRTSDGAPLLARQHTASRTAPRAVLGAELTQGQTLNPGDSLAAPGGRFSLVNDDGTIVVRTAPNRLNSQPYDQVVALGPTGSRLVLQTDGNLVLYTPTGEAAFNTATGGKAAQRLVIQDDGNLVLYGATTATVFFNFNTGAPESLLAGGVLLPGDQLSSGDGTSLIMQSDGNLVLYTGTTAVYATNTSGSGNAAILQEDGNVVVYNSANAPVFSTGTGSNDTSFNALVVSSGEFRVLNVGDAGVVSVFGSAWGSDTLLSGHLLLPGDRRTAIGGAVLITLQADGNFVKYNRGAPGFKVTAGADLGLMQPDGNFVLYRTSATTGALTAVFNTKSSGNPGSRLVVQSDNNLVVYTPDNRPVFASKK